jgi:hypothetical protein
MKMYISSNDYYNFKKPREILNYHKIAINNRNVLVVEVNEPLIGQKYGLSGDISTLYLINRFDEYAFDKLNKFPIDVHVFIVKKDETRLPSSLTEMQNIAWACLYDNEEDAVSSLTSL